jgi:hypothetical protein
MILADTLGNIWFALAAAAIAFGAGWYLATKKAGK